MKHTILLFAFLLLLLSGVREASSQTPAGTSTEPAKPKVATLVNTLAVMPYITGSLNLFSGKAFPANATGIGYGAGLAFDMTQKNEKLGFFFDFAFQDMRGSAQNNGSSVQGSDSVLAPATAYHYWQYILFEPFLKIQGEKKNGYFLIGASLGYAVLSETVSRGATTTEYALWNEGPFGNQFRFDLRAGIGVKLADIGKHDLILEARAGYPLTNVISNYQNASTGGEAGNWRIITIQANLGLRL
jgi:hypothetical protein